MISSPSCTASCSLHFPEVRVLLIAVPGPAGRRLGSDYILGASSVGEHKFQGEGKISLWLSWHAVPGMPYLVQALIASDVDSPRKWHHLRYQLPLLSL